MTAPTISVLIPVYNGERYLAEAIESVLAQTHTDFELIIVDDGSTDRTPEIIQIWVEKDRRIRFFRQLNQGISVALNTGLAIARAEWIARLDADDLMLPHRLERQMAFIAEHPDVKAFGSVCQYINEAGQAGRYTTVPAPVYCREDLTRHLASGQLIGLIHPSVMMHRSTVIDVGGYRSMEPAEDLDLWMRIADAGHLVLQQREALTKYRVHGGSETYHRCRRCCVMSEYILACSAARRAGKREPLLAEFERAWMAQPLPARWQATRARLGWLMYRKAGTEIMNRRWLKGAAQMAAAFALRPVYVAGRLAQQIGGT